VIDGGLELPVDDQADDGREGQRSQGGEYEFLSLPFAIRFAPGE
jgi:hypothetical protein